MPRAKTQSEPSFQKEKVFSLPPWRLGAKIFLEIILLAIPLGFEIGKKMPLAKTQRIPSSEKRNKIFFAPWRLGAKIFLNVLLLNILSVRSKA